MIPVANVPAADTYEFAADIVKIIEPLYNVEIGDVKGLKNTIGLICVSGDQNEVFFNYGFNGKTS